MSVVDTNVLVHATIKACSLHTQAVVTRGQCAGKQVHDASIVATMPAHGETRLLTFGRHVDRFGRSFTVVDP